MAYHDWYVGMKVVCVASAKKVAAFMRRYPGANWALANGVYTIREIRDDGPWRADRQPHLVLLLHEVDNNHLIGTAFPCGSKCYVEPGFNIKQFRPLRKRKTDISIFTAMLHGEHRKVTA